MSHVHIIYDPAKPYDLGFVERLIFERFIERLSYKSLLFALLVLVFIETE